MLFLLLILLRNEFLESLLEEPILQRSPIRQYTADIGARIKLQLS